MKKIITLLFFVGFLTTAFAQPDRHEQYGNQTSNNRSQSPKYSGDNNYGYSKSYPDNNGYNRDNQWNKRNNENEYAYNKGRDDNDNRDRDDMRRNHFSHPQYFNQKRNEDDSYRTRIRVPLGRILFGVSGLF